MNDAAINYPESMSAKAQSFIAGLIQKAPEERLCSRSLLSHPFLR